MIKSSRILLAALMFLLATAMLLFYFASTVFIQLFIALALAYILSPAVDHLEKYRVKRVYGILLVFILALLLGGGFTFFLLMSVAAELSNVQLNLPEYARHLYEITPGIVKEYLGIETTAKLSERLNELLQQARSAAPDIMKQLFSFLQLALSSTVSFILSLLGYLIIPLYLFYLLFDLPQLKSFVDSYVPPRYRNTYSTRVAEVDAILSGFVRGQLSVCAILALLYSIGLYAIGIDMAIAIGTLAGAAFIIPYVGTILGMVLSVIMALLKFNDLLHPLLCVGWFALVQLLEGFYITPKIVGDSVGLHPLAAIVALLIGGQLFGIMGMLLAVPAAAVLQVLLRSLTDYYRNSEFFLEK